MPSHREWTIYLAQDKHLDYNWCGTNTEIELRMVALMDYYLQQAQRKRGRWNLDCTLWLEVYRRHRGEQGAQALIDAIRDGYIGYAANRSVLLWGLLSTELAFRACYGARGIEQATGTPSKVALIMENTGLLWGAATVLTESGFPFLGRGIYTLRAESYNSRRESYPLFWWRAPNGKRILVHWDLYHETGSWGGYAEGAALLRAAGEKWDAFGVQTFGDRNTPEVYQKRREFIHRTVERHETYGDRYPISSILLLGTGHDNWTNTDDCWAFIEKFNQELNSTVRLVDARYEDFAEAAYQEIEANGLDVPTLEGSFGMCWEEWAAHLAGFTTDFREADRLLRLAEAAEASSRLRGEGNDEQRDLIQYAYRALLDFAEHDMGGCNRKLAAVSAGVRASAAVQSLDIARALSPSAGSTTPRVLDGTASQDSVFEWRSGRVSFDTEACAVSSIVDAQGWEWVPQGGTLFGEFVHTRYTSKSQRESVFPETLSSEPQAINRQFLCRQGTDGVEIQTGGARWGFKYATHWFFHATEPWIDVTYTLQDGWTEDAQTVQFCFPTNLSAPTYRYDTAGAILVAGSASEGGDDLPGANPDLFACQTFASAHDRQRGLILLTPDSYLLEFGPDAVRSPGHSTQGIPAQMTTMPMMNLTRNDRQFGQGGKRHWTFRYRLVLTPGAYDPIHPIVESQRFGTPPYLQVPGEVSYPLSELQVRFDAGPVTTFKTAEDDKRLILRLWNVTDSPALGSVSLPEGFSHIEICDGMERPKQAVQCKQSMAPFTVDARGILTLALCSEGPVG